ncbi:MAG TPA: ribonuclease P protein component [Bryobacteraceae bacterium]|nr:ribonuclease P protein component [Bryobacteraceae bacterium]
MTREPSATPNSFRFPKSARILRSTDFRRVYEHGQRFSGPFFAAFLLSQAREQGEGPRIGFTVPRAFGIAVRRNRAKRRLREQVRLRLADIAPQWDIVLNPRRSLLEAGPDELRREVDRLIQRCGR